MRIDHGTRALRRAAILLLSLLAAGCGGSGQGVLTSGSGSTDCTQPAASDADGCAYISLSDATGDFITYTVDVTGLTLRRADGTTVSVLPAKTRVDFTQYSNLSEFLTLASVPPGDYTSGTLTLDYSNADIEAEDATGNAVKLDAVDQSGDAIGSLDVEIRLDGKHSLLLSPGVPRLLNIDFNLDASNLVDLGDGTVTVQPFLVADVDPAAGVPQRVRGPLDSVDAAHSRFTLGLRPFDVLSGDYGKFDVYTDGSTVYEIDQTEYHGDSGLDALQKAGATTAVIAVGTFDFNSHEFIADQVYAGSSVPGGTLDAAEGVITARNGDDLTLRGATLIRANQSAVFRDSVKVTIGSGTKVHEAGDSSMAFSPGDISVGQEVLVFGTLTDTNPSSLQLDATGGYVRMEETRIDGTVSAVSGGDLTVSLQSIEGRPVGLFDFTGTHSDPANYDVALAGNIGSTVVANDPVRLIGFASPFGSAPPDFDAKTVVDFVDSDALLSVGWSNTGTTQAFDILDAHNGIVINLQSSPVLHRLRQGGVVTDLLNLSSSPTISSPAYGIYAIWQNGSVQVHLSFSDFVADLQSRLAANAKVNGFFALGGFDNGSNVMTSGGIAVILH